MAQASLCHSKDRTHPLLRILEFCHTSFTRIDMRLIRRAVAAAAVLLASCASSVHATLALDKESCKTLDLGRFLALGFLTVVWQVACARDFVSFHHGKPSFTHFARIRYGKYPFENRAWRAIARVLQQFCQQTSHLYDDSFSTPSPPSFLAVLGCADRYDVRIPNLLPMIPWDQNCLLNSLCSFRLLSARTGKCSVAFFSRFTCHPSAVANPSS